MNSVWRKRTLQVCVLLLLAVVAAVLLEDGIDADAERGEHLLSSTHRFPTPAGSDPSASGFAYQFGRYFDRLLKDNGLSFEGQRVGTTGSKVCARCHESIAAGYDRTGMGHSLSEMGLQSHASVAVIDDPDSPRLYRVLVRDGVMWHQEWLSSRDSNAGRSSLPPVHDEVLVNEYPVKWQIGSGTHARSYLIEVDGYLIESPVTWYAAREAWGMSPGFEHPGHAGFGRVAESGCLYCHAGEASPMDGSSHKLTIHEAAIGCERCHGAGQLHVARHDSALHVSIEPEPVSPKSEVDGTIINPRHLDRRLSDSICGQCHLRSAATVLVPGARLDDFRPGLNLADLRTDYRLDRSDSLDSMAMSSRVTQAANDDSMTVVGHIEQLQKSRCYQMSELSCVTCHDPHRHNSADKKINHYRSICLQCHDKLDCHVATRELRKWSPDNDCTACHMPRSGTDIPHLTFTHHRIGIHSARNSIHERGLANAANFPPGELVPLTEADSVPQPVRDAMLGLAYLEFSGRNNGLAHAQHYRERAFKLLIEAWHRKERSPEIASGLAALGTGDGLPSFAESVRTAAEQLTVTASMRVNFLLSQALWNADKQRFAQAADLMEKVVAVRRVPTDWRLLADFNRASGQVEKTAEALEKALKISPLNTAQRRWLAEYNEYKNDHDAAELHRRVLAVLDSWYRARAEKR